MGGATKSASVTATLQAEVAIARAYLCAKVEVLASPYNSELVRAARSPEDLSESEFLCELAWVILSAGISEQVVKAKFPLISSSFLKWRSARTISERADECISSALRYFRHERKIRAIAAAATTLSLAPSFAFVREKILQDPIRELQSFAYIGPVTAFHIAKNIGVGVAKPDRHLLRLARSSGFESVGDFCGMIACFLGEDIRVVDSVLWRFATMNRDYVLRFSGFRNGVDRPN
jgi:hypothetical protein